MFGLNSPLQTKPYFKMKLFLSIFTGIFLSFSTFSQTNQLNTPNSGGTNSKFSFGEVQGRGANEISNEQKIQIQEKLNLIDSHLEAIEIKRKYIQGNPDQNAIAEREAWFKDMDRQIEELNERKRVLTALLNK